MNIIDFAVGTDIEEISRFEKYSKNPSDPFLKRIYTKTEIDYCFSHKTPEYHLAARFSGKEAVYKALSSLGIKNIRYSDIEIRNDENGVPFVTVNHNSCDNFIFRLSLSHGNGNSLASVVVIKVEN